jgi:hypothetical protein
MQIPMAIPNFAFAASFFKQPFLFLHELLHFIANQLEIGRRNGFAYDVLGLFKVFVPVDFHGRQGADFANFWVGFCFCVELGDYFCDVADELSVNLFFFEEFGHDFFLRNPLHFQRVLHGFAVALDFDGA